MNYKKIIILSIFFICFIGLSAVSAADNSTDNTEIDNEIISEDNIIGSCDEDILSDGTYYDLENKIGSTTAGYTAYLYNNYTLSSGYSSTGISINKQITVDGNGYTIDAKNNCRIFSVSASNVVLKNIVFKNAYYYGNGGAIYWTGTGGSIINCTFINDHSQYGGAVYWHGSSGKIINSTFTGNYAYNNGGAVYWYTSYGTLNNCRFNNNYVSGSSGYGGAVYWNNANGNLKNSNFTGNKAYYGSAVYWSGSSGTLDNCNFNENGPYSTYNYGGAVYWAGSSGNLKNSKFTKNRAYYTGGAVYWTSNYGTLDNCEFNNNTASNSDGGAIYWTGSNGDLIDSNFTDNRAYYTGGAVYWSSSSGEISYCNFLNNSLTSSSGHGGAIYKDSYSTSIEDCNFTKNTAKYGGALTIKTVNSDSISNSNFNNNNASYGEAIEWISSVCKMTNCSVNGEKTRYDKYCYISSKLTPSMSLTVSDIVLGEKLDLAIKFGHEGTDGKVNITVTNSTGETVYNSIIDVAPTVHLSIANLKRGSYSVNVRYTGDNIYYSTSKSNNIKVHGWTSSIDFTVHDIMWGTPVELAPKVTSGATGSIEIYLNNVYQDTIKIGGKYTLTGLGGPTSSIRLVYLGDDNYEPNSTVKIVNVERLNTTFVAPESIESGNPSPITITINEDATGSIRVTLDSQSYNGNVIDGKFTFNARQLKSGTKTMRVYYYGDSKYNPFDTSFDVEVTERVPIIQLDIDNVLSGRSVTIEPILTYGATGTFDIYVDGIFKKTIDYDSTYTLSSQSIGKHTVKVIYSGDDYYASSHNQTVFRVFKFYPIEIQNSEIIYGSGKHFNATFYDEYGNILANKLVSFRIDGNDNVVMTDNDGVAVLNMNFPIGNYTITTINTIVNEELDSNLEVFTSIHSQDMTRAYNTGTDFKVRLYGEDAKPLLKGYAIFTVGGKNYAVRSDNEGYATLNAGLTPGSYTVVTTNALTGESKTNKLTIFSSINANNMIRGYNSGLDFQARFVDNNNIHLINQKVIFKIGTKVYEALTDSNGYAILNEKLPVGEYIVEIYNPVTGENSVKNLTIAERIVENNNIIRIQGEDSYYTIRVIGDDGNPVGANEIVKITINEGAYEIRTDARGYATFKIDQNIGSYIITAEYKEYSVVNDVHVLEKVDYIRSLNVNNINYKQDETITLEMYSYDRNAYITFAIMGNDGYENIITRDGASSITLTVSELNATGYTVTANYYDIANHKFSSAVRTFNVFKIDPTIIITVTNANVGENATIAVNIPDVEGTVVIKVGNNVIHNANIAKNGVIIKNIDYLNEGSYLVSVTYNGDNNYNKLTKTDTLIIIQDKITTSINAQDLNLNLGSEAYLIATLTDEYGNVMRDRNVSIYFNDMNSIRTTDNNGQVKLRIANAKANVYNAVITFVGDDTFAGTTKTVKITVTDPNALGKISLKLKKIKVKASAKKVVLKATLKINGKAAAKKVIKFKFNKKTYKAKTNKKGVAKVKLGTNVLKKLKVGKKVKYQAGYGKKTVKKTVKVQK